MMADPSEKKPDGWDDVPAEIPDPEAKKPEDWDSEEVIMFFNIRKCIGSDGSIKLYKIMCNSITDSHIESLICISNR